MAQVGYTMSGFESPKDSTLDSMNESAEVPTNNDIQNLYVGGAHSCVITEGELMKCWGNNSAGQLGIGNSESMGDEPNEMGTHLPYLDLGTGLVPESAALGMSHTCILFTNNSLKCFGDIEALGLGYTDANGAGDGYLETGDYLPFWPAPTGRNVSLIAAGWYHTCAVLDDGSMTCWGENNHGQLGMGNTTDLGLQSDQTGDSISYVSLPTGVTISNMALGADHTCVLYDTGDVACWGGNDFGQLGIGSTEDIRDEAAESLTNISFPSGRYAIDITAGEGFTCALLDNNEAICWGLNDVGQLGQGNSNNYGDSGSEPVSGLSTIDLHSSATIRTIDAGYDHVCVSLNNNAVKCWGGNLFGHLGIGISGPTAHRGDDVNEMGSNLPSISLGGSMNPKAVEVGENFACMLKQSGTMPVKCWGTSVNGRLGYENTETLGDSSTDNLANVLDFALDSEYASVDCGASPFNSEMHILPAFQLDSNQKGRTLDIAFRSDGCPGIVYSDDNTDNLRFAMYDNGIWVFEYPYTSNISNSSALDVSLVFDDNDVPQIAWSDFGYDTTNHDTHYATKANGKWNHVQLENSYPVTYDTEIIHFGDGDLEIIASPFTQGWLLSELCSASTDCLESSDWNSQTIIATFAYMQGLDSDIGLNGDAWVSQSITSGSTDSFHIVSKPTGGSWATSSSLSAPNSTGSTSAISDIEVAPDGTVHAVYLHEDYATDGIMYVSCSGGRSNCNTSSNWSFIHVPHVTNKTFSLAVDYDLVPHVFFNSSSSLQYTKLVDGSWTTPVEILNLAVNEVRADFHPNGKLWLGAQLTANDNIWMIEGASFGGNGMSIDIDGDGWLGIEEFRCGSDMINSSSTPADADGDGICDAEDEIHDLASYGEPRTISVGDDFACGLTAIPEDGNATNASTVYCWGSNSHSQLGNIVASTIPFPYVQYGVPVTPSQLPLGWLAVDVDVGARHACAIGIDGDIYCWGDNTHGQLGINSTVTSSLPVEVELPNNNRARSISLGSQHTCAVTVEDTLYCWGDSSNQQLGEYFITNSSGYIEETFSSSNWLDTTSFSDVYIGQYGSHGHDNDWTYSTDDGGTLKWDLKSGNTYYNEFSFTINALSDGYITFDVKSDMGSSDYVGLHIDSSNQGWYHPPSTWTTRNHSFTAGTHELAFVGINQYYSSGFNDAWLDNIVIHAGFSLEEGGILRTPSQVSLGSMIVSEVTTGDDHTCVTTSTSAAYCWGDNGGSTTMTLGNSSFTGTNSSSPLLVDLAGTGSQYSGPQPPRFGLLSAGAGATCGTLLTNASTICWGTSSAGTSILGGSSPSINGTFVSLNENATSLSVGHHHACAVAENTIRCWGKENAGELGDGGTSSSTSSTPVEVDITGHGTPFDISVSETGNTSCGLFKRASNYSFMCWGSHSNGALGQGAGSDKAEPTNAVTTLQYGWVNPTATSSNLDVANYDIAEVSGGQHNYCARSYQGLVKCWGYGSQGRLGIGSTTNIGDSPNEMGDYQEFTDLGTNLFATDITTGYDFACAVLNNTQIKCWGENGYYQLSNGDTSDRGDGPNEMGDNLPYVRTQASTNPVTGFVKVDAGHRSACALTFEGAVYCWGYNDNYLISSASWTMGSATLQTQLSRPAIDIAVGDYHACVILDNHQVQCWGRNSEGQLGTGNKTTPNQNTAQKERPYVDLGSDVGALDIMAGGSYTCAILTTEGTVCWGEGANYRHGRNSTNDFSSMGDGLGNGTGSPYDTIAKPNRSSLATNSQGTCIVDEWSEVQCWGHNYIAGTTTAAPITINAGGHVRSVAVADGPSACAIRIDGSLVCWGTGSYGQLGQGDSSNNYPPASGEIIIEYTDVRLWSPDTDFDGMINLWDDDDDDDGVLDINDAFSLDECASVDTDNDGMPDTITSACSTLLVLDLDDDNDGWTDVNEILCDTNTISSLSVPIDTDSDGTCNYLDMDDDNDGWTDSQEHECEAQSFTSFRAVGSSSGTYPNSVNGELYFGGPNSDELRYLGRSSDGYGGLWMWPSATKDSQGPSSSSQRFSNSNYGDITLEHQDGVTYYADRYNQGQFNDEINGLSSHSATSTQYGSSTSFRSEISLDADNRVYVADGYYRFWHQNTIDSSTYSYTNLPNTNSNNKHHLEAQDNGTVHHLWWHSNDLKYTQSHPVTGSSGRSYDSIETIGGWGDLQNHQFDLEVDSNGVAHVALYRSSSSSYAITYMNNSAGSFSTIGFENSLPNSAGHVDLDIDPLGRVNLAWTDSNNKSVYHTIIDGTTTNTQFVLSTSGSIHTISQALDPVKNQSYIFTSSGSDSTVSHQGSFEPSSIDSTIVPGDIDSDGICDNLETAPVIYPLTPLEIGSSASISPSFPGLPPTLISNTTPLPAGLTLDQSTGVITGTPINSNSAFSVTMNTTSAQENWTGTIVIKIIPIAPLLTNYNSNIACAHSDTHQNIEFASDGSMFYSGNWHSYCNSLPTDLPGLENKSTFDTGDLIIAKRSVDGVWQWAHVIESAATLKSSDIALNSNDEPLLLFYVNSNFGIEFDRSHEHNIISSSMNSGTSLVLVQFNGTGHVVWNEFSRPSGSYGANVRHNDASENSIVVSPNGNITIMGEYYGNGGGVSIGFGTLNVSRNSSGAHWQPFIARLDSSGVVQWMNTGKTGQHSQNPNHQYSLDLAASSDGGVFLATQSLGVTSFGNLTTKPGTSGNYALNIFSIDSTGQAEWYQMVSASGVHLFGISIAVFDDDSVHVTATPNRHDTNHGTIQKFYETGVSTTSSGYNAGWNNTVSFASTHQFSTSEDSRAWLLTARLNGNNGTPIWVDLNTDKISGDMAEGYGSRGQISTTPSPVSYIQNNVVHVYVTDKSSSGTSDAASFYGSSTIDNDEIHHVLSATSSSDSDFAIIDFGPDGNDRPFFFQRSDQHFYWGHHESIPEFSSQTVYSFSNVRLNRMIGIAGHPINEKMPQVGVYFSEYPVDYHNSGSTGYASWSLIGTNGSTWLPNNLNFESSTGRFYGTPTTITANATYWLNHTTQGRTISTLITFGVSPTAPTLSYSGGTQTLERGDTMTDWTPTITGINYLQSITVTPSLPNGIFIDQSNGTISGTPMYNMSSTQYSIVACNSWGVCGTAETITLVINEPLASPVWGGNNTLYFARDVNVRECPVTSAGGMVEIWSIASTPNLPYGLSFNTTTGCFEGTPLLYTNAQNYTVTAQNSGGQTQVQVSINITGAGIGLTYPTGSLILENGTAMQPIAGQTTGDNAQSWSISPSLPNGLSFGLTNGTIWGTPSVSSNPVNYTVTVTSNSGVTATFTIEIEILEPVEEITLSLPFNSLSLTNLTEMQPVSVQTTGDPAVSWSISPALPSGLELGPTNGTLWGIPIQANASTVYTITAVTLGGATDNISLTIEVLDIVEEIYLTMPTNLVMLVNGSAMQPISGQTSGDTPVTWTISPALPSGLDINASNGTIWGTPTTSSILTTYTVTVYTAGGYSDSATIQIIVQEDTDGDSIPDIVDNDDDNDGVLDGNEETGCELDPDCDDDGTNDGEDAFPLDPSEDSDFDNDGIGDNADDDDDNDGWTEANETACGGHSDLDPLDYPSDIDGDGECDFTDTTDDREIAISYPVNVLDLTINQAMTTMSPTVTGGNVTSWSISPELPNGLIFNETGVLSGTPSSNSSTLMYVITASNGQYSTSTTLTITVYEVTGDADADGISDALDPDDDNDGWTDLEEAACNNTNSLDANDYPTDLDGDGICDFVDNFRDLPLAVSYPSQILQLANGSMMDTFTPTVAGGDVAEWEISGELPEGLTFGWSPARDASMDGSIRGTPTEEIPPTTYTIWANNSVSSATFEVTISVLLDTDTDGTPDIYDLDDDGDTWSDALEGLCGTDSLDVSDSPSDEDDDGICDALSTGPDITDTDGDGVPDESDAFPNDPAAAFDNDNDGMPDDIFGFSQSTPPLIEDLDDDNDGWLDTREAECGSDRFDNSSMPIDSDQDGTCDGIDQDRDGDGFNNIVDAFPGDKSAFADLDNDGLPDNLTGSSNTGLVADTDDDGDNYTDQEEIECGSDPMDLNSIPPDADGNGLCDAKENTSTIVEPEPDEEGLFLISSKYWWCCILLLLLLLFLLIPLMGTNKKIILARKQGPEPPYTESSPKFLEGKGTRKDPFVLASFTVQPGSTQVCSEKITITNISSGYLVGMSDRMETENDNRFQMLDVKDKDEFEENKSVNEIEVGEDGTIVVKFLFTDEEDPTLAGGNYDATIRIGSASVYFSWNIVVEGDLAYIAQQKAEEEARIEAAAKAKAEEEDQVDVEKAKAEAEAAKVKAEAEAEAAKVKAEAEAEAAKVKAEAEAAKVKAAAEAEAAKVKAEAEAEVAKVKAEAEAAKADAERVKEEAEAEANKRRKEAEKEAAKRQERMDKELEERRKRLANLDEKARKKEEELLRVAEKAKNIDFGTLGVASSSKVKKKVKENSTEIEVGDTSKFTESGEAYISDVEGGARISWKSKSGNKLMGVKGIKRGFAAAAVVTVRDDLQTIKGIGPFIEDKLHALGIFTFDQIGNMNSELEETVNVAIEFFSGRVKRDEWTKQARKLAKNR